MYLIAHYYTIANLEKKDIISIREKSVILFVKLKM